MFKLFNKETLKKADLEFSVTLYFSQDGKKIIIMPKHITSDGISYEQENGIFLNEGYDVRVIGESFLNAYNMFSFKDSDLTKIKKSEWPAYKISKLSTINEFERLYLAVNCVSLNSSNILVRASTPHQINREIELSVLFNPKAEAKEIGEKILTLVRTLIMPNKSLQLARFACWTVFKSRFYGFAAQKYSIKPQLKNCR